MIASLKHFVFDTQSMLYLCQRAGFVQVAVFLINRRLEETRVNCQLCFYNDDERIDGNIKFIEREYGLNLENINQYRRKTLNNKQVDSEKNLNVEKCNEANDSIKNQSKIFESTMSSTNFLELKEVFFKFISLIS